MVIYKWNSKSRTAKRFGICCKYAAIIILGTVTLLLLVMTIQKVDPHRRGKITDLRSFVILPQTSLTTPGCLPYRCSVLCVNTTDLELNMKQAIKETGCANIDTLHIDRQTFPYGILKKYWTEIDTNFYEILITNSNLRSIDPEAFDGNAFTQTFILNLEGVPLPSLEGGTLLGLPKLESLTINAPLGHISRVFFQPIRATLKTLKLTQMTSQIKFDDIFGVSNMTSLVDLDLSGNQFYDPITIQGFLFLSTIRYLDLSNSCISVIGMHAFDPIKNTLKFLDLSHNNLTTLGYGTLDSVLVSGRTYIYLLENNWICNCDLQALVNYYNVYPEVFLDVPTCRAPQAFYGAPINTVLNCESASTYFSVATSEEDDLNLVSAETTNEVESRSSDITEVSVTVSVAPTNTYVSVPCMAKSKNSSSMIKYMHLEPPSHDFSIAYLGDLSVEINVEGYDEDLTILWYTDPDIYGVYTTESDYGCRGKSNGSLIIKNLVANVSYTFCVIPRGKVSITPFNCLPFYIPSSRNACVTWINSDNEHLFIILVCIILVVGFGIGAGCTYFIIRQFPEIIKGSKRVLVVKTPKDDRKPKISIVSEHKDIRNPKRIAPLPPPYRTFCEENSSYEIPIEVVENEYLDEFQRYYAEPLSLNEESSETPPPLPKRNSEQIYCSPTFRDKFTKRSI